MSSYFPLLPNILLEDKQKIIGSLTLLNSPNNLAKNNLYKLKKVNIYIGIYKIYFGKWKLLDILKCPYKTFLSINREMLSVPDNLMVVCVTRKDREFPKLCETLPKAHSIRIDNSAVEERASYNFTFKKSSTSYQGEYPSNMAKINKGSFLTFDPLKSKSDSIFIEDYLLLMNLNISAKFNSDINVNVYDPENKLSAFALKARQNDISIFNLKSFKKKYQNKIMFYCSKESIFIPLFLTLDKKNNQLSFEHTHPPSDIFIGRDKQNAVKILKREWII